MLSLISDNQTSANTTTSVSQNDFFFEKKS
uniref:Uncharacterized protein n=1 Tax=Arundo donax TaxID=35708 RepID=A0A0A9EJ91_ARUDO